MIMAPSYTVKFTRRPDGFTAMGVWTRPRPDRVPAVELRLDWVATIWPLETGGDDGEQQQVAA